jgi:Protein tyrosine phosphatase-like protein, PTPLA
MILDIFQCMQILDVVFAALKFTNNSVITTFLQVFSRVAMVLAIFPLLKPKGTRDGDCLGVFLCMINWSMIEVIRFGFYALKQVSSNGDSTLAKIFGHLRYNVFIFAYILGVSGENIAIYYGLGELNALEASGAKLPWTIRMPNKWNFVFDFKSFLLISPILYLGGFPGLYMHMWRQRARFYGSDKKNAADASKKKQ